MCVCVGKGAGGHGFGGGREDGGGRDLIKRHSLCLHGTQENQIIALVRR